jgi:hypothetical protein
VRFLGIGSEDWEVRAGHTYELVETAQMTMRPYDTAGKPHDIKAAGTITLGELADLVKAKHGLPA